MTKFDSKKFKGNRIYVRLPKQKLIERIMHWNEKKECYEYPTSGHWYRARRKVSGSVGPFRYEARHFDSLDECHAFQRFEKQRSLPESSAKVGATFSHGEPTTPADEVCSGTTLSQVFEFWKLARMGRLAETSQVHYLRLIERHIRPYLFRLPVKAVNEFVVRDWLFELQKSVGKNHQSKLRKNFDHELQMLGILLRLYTTSNFADAAGFSYPITREHREQSHFKKQTSARRLDLTFEDFAVFRNELSRQPKFGETLAALATVQFTCALRISEAVALHWEDVKLDQADPQNSSLTICRHALFFRRKDKVDRIEAGFKNATGQDGTKTLPLCSFSYQALKNLSVHGLKGLVFRNEEGKFFSMRQVQYAYDTAFEKAGLPYRGTHIMRHGGASWVLNLSNGDLHVAQQLLGNLDIETVKIYAKRNKGALQQTFRATWDTPQSRQDGIQTRQDSLLLLADSFEPT